MKEEALGAQGMKLFEPTFMTGTEPWGLTSSSHCGLAAKSISVVLRRASKERGAAVQHEGRQPSNEEMDGRCVRWQVHASHATADCLPVQINSPIA